MPETQTIAGDNKASCKAVLDMAITFVEFILVLTIVLDCNSVYRAVKMDVNPRELAMYVGNISAYILIGLFLIKDRQNIEVIKSYKYLFVLSAVFVLAFNALNVVNSTGTCFFGYFLFFMNAMVVLFGIYRKDKNTFKLMYTLEHIVLFIAITSTLLWFGSSVLELWGRNSDIYVNWGGEYYNSNYLNLCIRRWIYDSDMTKNLGIFTEPPMFGLFLGIGLYTELFLKKKCNLLIVVLFLGALISNRAILAMMVSLIALFFKFVEIIGEKKHAKIYTVLSTIIVILGIVVLYLYKKNTGWGSFATHIDDFAAALKCWIHYPILGCGYNTETPIQAYMSDFRLDNLGLSNSAAVVLAEGGIALFLYYLIPFLVMMLMFFKKNRRLAYWGAGMFFMWVVVIFHTRLLVFFIMALGYSLINADLEKSNQKTRLVIKFENISDNISDDIKLFTGIVIELPYGMIAMMGIVLTIFSVYGVFVNIHSKEVQFSGLNTIASIIIFFAEIGTLVLEIKSHRLTKLNNILIQIVLWFIYMVVGQPYWVIDHFLQSSGLRIQDSWWKPIVVFVMLFLVGLLIELLIKKFRHDKKKAIGEIRY